MTYFQAEIRQRHEAMLDAAISNPLGSLPTVSEESPSAVRHSPTDSVNDGSSDGIGIGVVGTSLSSGGSGGQVCHPFNSIPGIHEKSSSSAVRYGRCFLP